MGIVVHIKLICKFWFIYWHSDSIITLDWVNSISMKWDISMYCNYEYSDSSNKCIHSMNHSYTNHTKSNSIYWWLSQWSSCMVSTAWTLTKCIKLYSYNYSAVTRNIDVLTYDVRNVIANQWAFSVVSTMNDNEIFDRRALNLSSFTVNRLHVQARTLWIPNVGIVYWDGVTVRSVIGVAAWTNNIAASWTNWVWLNLYMNNIKYIGAFVPSLAFTTIDVGGGTLWYPIFWCIRDLRIWKTRPTDTELLFLSNNP